MKKLTVAMMGCCALGSAFAQSSVRLYGIVDVGLEHARTSGGTAPERKLTSVVNGPNSLSRLGFTGTEDLGGGMSANFVLEHGFDSDTGANTAPVFFNRNSFVGLKGGWGEVRLGRTYTPGFFVMQSGDVMRYGWFANAGTFGRLTPSGQPRVDNGLVYLTPAFGGVSARIHYGLGAESATPPRDSGRFLGVSVEYSKEPIYVGIFHHRREDVFPANSTTTQTSTYQGIAARYEVSGWAVAGGVVQFDPAGPNTATAGKQQGWWLGGMYKMGIGEIRAAAGRIKADLTGAVDPRATLWGVSYNYPLSRRTNVYAAYGSMDNNQTGAFQLESSSRAIALPVAAGVDTKAFSIGIRHTF